MTDESDYSLLQPDVFSKLLNLDWFIAAISLEYRSIAQSFKCVPILSRERLVQAYDIFWHDVDRGKTQNLPEGTISLDQFKLSSYLCFWLRRINPVREIRAISSLGDHKNWLDSEERLSFETENFLLYGNEIVSLAIAVRLSQYLTAVIAGNRTSISVKNKKTYIRQIDQETLVEYGKILKHKNISSHGIMMALHMLSGSGQKTLLITPNEW
ncbi:hypothetical protein Q4610_18150 [Sphingobium sp. HBC34]|uniref:Uncharacterized protein n=1 Tax=Sphingobium cyanobacteriorum TaxID=3063954 RepID=A0ABT8ZR78_9SPHN|nr:hypothetical protein [Sphingobium sp. HBC34]MDO7836973.1 hypothetical protein [Sphingobium sp. HBC34]